MPRVSTDVLVADYARGDSLEVIARSWRIPPRTVASRLRRAGVVLRKQGRRRSALAMALGEIAAMRGER